MPRRGAIFLNSSIIDIRPNRDDITVYDVPLAEISDSLGGNPRGQNIMMLGAFLKATGVLSPEAYLDSLQQAMKGKKSTATESNRKAFNAGYEYPVVKTEAR